MPKKTLKNNMILTILLAHKVKQKRLNPNPQIETRMLHKLLISTAKQKRVAEPMGATYYFSFHCENNILHILSRFYLGIREFY